MANLIRFPARITRPPNDFDVRDSGATLAYLRLLHESLSTESRHIRDHLNDFFTGSRTILSGSVEFRYKHTATNFTTDAEVIIGVDTSGGGVTITLSASDAKKGRTILIKDESGDAGTNNITVTPDGGKFIDGAASFTMDTDYQSTFVYSDGTNWYTGTLSSSTITVFGTSEFAFRWPHPISDNQDFVLGGIDLGKGSDFTVTGIEGYFEVAPTTSLTIRVMNGSGDGTPQNISVTTNYFSNFAISKAVLSANKLFIRLNGSPDAAEHLAWARAIYTVP